MSFETDNALVSMKNRFCNDIDNCIVPEDVETLHMIYYRLRFMRELWLSLGYSYKGKELAERIAIRCDALQDLNECWVRRDSIHELKVFARTLEQHYHDDQCKRHTYSPSQILDVCENSCNSQK